MPPRRCLLGWQAGNCAGVVMVWRSLATVLLMSRARILLGLADILDKGLGLNIVDGVRALNLKGGALVSAM